MKIRFIVKLSSGLRYFITDDLQRAFDFARDLEKRIARRPPERQRLVRVEWYDVR